MMGKIENQAVPKVNLVCKIRTEHTNLQEFKKLNNLFSIKIKLFLPSVM